MASLAHLHSSKTTLGTAVEAFFADRDLAPATRRAYRATYGSACPCNVFVFIEVDRAG